VANFLSKPNAINDPLFHVVGGALTAMAEDPNAVNHALERVGTTIMNASERYSALPNREKGHVIGETMFGLVNPEGSTEGGELALKIADGVATHVDAAVMKTIQQSLKAAEEAAKTSPEVVQEMKQMLQNYLRDKGLTGPELEYAGVPKGYFDGLEAPKPDDHVLFMKGDKGLPQGVKPSEKVVVTEQFTSSGRVVNEIEVSDEVLKAAELQGFDREAVKEKLQKIADAVKDVYAQLGKYDAAKYGSERAYGNKFHEMLRQSLNNAGDPTITTEASYLKGQTSTWGKLGTSRIDISLGDAQEPFASVCLKTLKATPSPQQERGWIRNLPHLKDGSIPPRMYLKLPPEQ
jgi:predicted translin family RNA/ssDNA-binding protein